VCYKAWKDSPDETFLTEEIKRTLRNVDPEAESKYSLMKLESYKRVCKALWLAGAVAPVRVSGTGTISSVTQCT